MKPRAAVFMDSRLRRNDGCGEKEGAPEPGSGTPPATRGRGKAYLLVELFSTALSTASALFSPAARTASAWFSVASAAVSFDMLSAASSRLSATFSALATTLSPASVCLLQAPSVSRLAAAAAVRMSFMSFPSVVHKRTPQPFLTEASVGAPRDHGDPTHEPTC